MLVQDKDALMSHMGKKELIVQLDQPLVGDVPDALRSYGLEVIEEGARLRYVYDTKADRTGITSLLNDLQKAGLQMVDMETRQSSLEEIFVGLVKGDAA